MTGLDSIAKQLFEKIRSRFPKIVMGDENGAPTSDEGQARFYDFDWVVNGENQGAVSISISEAESLKVYYSQNMLENLPEPIENEWYNFLKEMRFFAKKHMMGFDTRDIAKSNLDKRDYQYLANKQVQESTMYGTTKSSYEELDKTKLIIRHKKEITPEQSGARTRHISSLFIENESGERFKYPFAHLAGARAMARHVANSGVPHDDFGKHIISTSENIAKLTAFKRFVGKKDFMNTTSNDIIEGSNLELDNLRSHLKKLQGQGYYVQSKENFIPVESTGEELGEDIINDLTNAFTIPQFNEELKDMFPLLHSIHQKRVAETTVSLDDVLDESDDRIIFKGKEIDTDTIEYDMQDYSDMIAPLEYAKYTDGTEVDDADLGDLDELPAMIDWIAQDYTDRMADQADMYRDMERERFETSNTPENEFEEWADSVVDEALDKQRIDMLNKMIGKSLPVGPDATNAINSLKGIIEDEGLMNELKSLAESDPESCARPAIYRYLKQNDPEALDDLDFGDMTMEDDDDTTDVTIDKDGAMKLAGDNEEPKDEKASTEDIIEFVRSFYDTETGAFPKGETGVVISARKRFGDSVGDLVEKFVSKLTGNEVQVEDDQDVEEGSIKYMHSLKAKGHSDEEIAKELDMTPDEVRKAMAKTNEDLEYIKDKLAKLIR
jgi:biotin operon repressor